MSQSYSDNGIRLLYRCASLNLPLVKRLVCRNGHPDLITDTKENKTPLRQIEGHLSDYLIEALRKELLTDGANATLPGLHLHQLLVKHLPQSRHINPRRWLVTHILNPLFTLLRPLSWGQDCVEHVFLLGPAFHRG